MQWLQIFADAAGYAFATQIGSWQFAQCCRSDDTLGFGISATRKQTTHNLSSSMSLDIASPLHGRTARAFFVLTRARSDLRVLRYIL
jgi:hypothetical protein